MMSDDGGTRLHMYNGIIEARSRKVRGPLFAFLLFLAAVTRIRGSAPHVQQTNTAHGNGTNLDMCRSECESENVETLRQETKDDEAPITRNATTGNRTELKAAVSSGGLPLEKAPAEAAG